ncbi:hypothetical protein B9Z55_010848 [Caenorhabditis nigoni]|uniref:Uncharacterized protein n=1 Tax=Caenorhabditis nigoni TaxID=1611254 RepID=A0A2G5UIJ8_9PELO|nr:hypothetical protein B9Z55_010848 [Caenorhabditis nigoni]
MLFATLADLQQHDEQKVGASDEGGSAVEQYDYQCDHQPEPKSRLIQCPPVYLQDQRVGYISSRLKKKSEVWKRKDVGVANGLATKTTVI